MVTQPTLHLHGVGTASKEQRCQRVPKRVESSPRSPDLLGDWLQHTSRRKEFWRNIDPAWRDQLRGLGVDANCAADQPLDRFGRGDIYLVGPPEQWSRASEIIENLD
jgi:hypothetical protein